MLIWQDQASAALMAPKSRFITLAAFNFYDGLAKILPLRRTSTEPVSIQSLGRGLAYKALKLWAYGMSRRCSARAQAGCGHKCFKSGV